MGDASSVEKKIVEVSTRSGTELGGPVALPRCLVRKGREEEKEKDVGENTAYGLNRRWNWQCSRATDIRTTTDETTTGEL